MTGIDAALTFLANAVWQVPVVVLMMSAALRLLRRSPARDRERLCRAALFAACLLPMASLLRDPASGAPPRIVAPAPVPVESAAPAAASVIVASVRPEIAQLLAAAFALYVAWRLAALGRAWAACARLARGAAPADHLRRLARGAAADMDVDAADIRCSPHITAPLTVGLFRPVILLPPGFGSADVELVRAALLHELAHVRRRDFAWNLLVELAVAPVAFHPVLWTLRRVWAAEREMACDEAACASGLSWRRYARALVRAAEWMVPGTPPTSAMALGGSLEERIMRLRETKGVSVPPSRRLRGAVALLAAAALVPATMRAVVVEAAQVEAAVGRVETALAAAATGDTTGAAEALEGRAIYVPGGRRDPFADPRRAAPSALPEGPERYRIDEISLRGIVRDASGRVLMVWTPSNRTYFVRAGQRFADGTLVAIGDAGASFQQQVEGGGAAGTKRVERELHAVDRR